VSFDYHADDMAIKEKTEMNFELYKWFQTWLYEYNFWIWKIESWIIYLKAFEITNWIPLSVHNLENRSSISVFNQSDKIVMFWTNNDFTIYEWAWGVPYAARFEVWFRPNNWASEKKLMEKVYKIEGWDR
jgi:hypothetical protein